ncbi:protein TIS11-like isoform X2 [Anopheles stephensi]|uniref:protein TIS11-like isoform X2 n=1 Tax=Anopheles stephensi TaxID=30069 RepID=UPI00165881C8|nr:protein TIS11-like isoform X2 [Anopheles stephensi]
MSTAIMHSTSLYDFGEYPRNKNQNSTSRSSNSQMIVGGGGVGGGNNVHNITPVGVSSNSSNQLTFSSVYLNATSNSNAQRLNLLFALDEGATGPSQHKQQQQHGGGGGGGGAHHSLYRTASQPATRHKMEDILDMLSLNAGMKLLPELTSFGSAASSANSINSNNGGSNSSNSSNNQHATSNTSSSSGHRKLERTQSEPLPQQVNTSRYKTELCRPYEEAGECKYGDKCQFAHGMQELRNLQRHPKYKTELCRTFHSVGFCPYGPRCHFVHNAEEARNHNRNVAAYHARLAAAAAAAGGNNSSQSSQGATRSSSNNNNNGPSMINSNNHHHGHGHHHNQQQHSSSSSLKTLSVVQLHTAAAAAILQQQTSIAHHQQQQQQLHHHQQQQQHHHHHHHQLPLSPALSMSTGSDRASPIGSLSLSPTTSMANFFPEAISPTLQQGGAIPQPFLLPTSPPASPIEGLSPMASPPPSSPSLVAMTLGGGHGAGGAAGNNSCSTNGQEERLPVFNLLSSVVDPYSQLTL